MSLDCLDSYLFILPQEENEEKRRKVEMLRALFTPAFWELAESRQCLKGRLVLLNKSHPKTPELGKFRPIRICSNVVKVLERSLLPSLTEWGERNLKEQFGFLKGSGC